MRYFKLFKIFKLLIPLAVLTASCRAKPRASVETIESKKATIIQREIELTIPEDSSSAAYLIAPDKNGQTRAKKLSSHQNKRAGEPVINIDTNGILRVKCPCLEFKATAVVNDTKTESSTQETVNNIVYQPSKWQWFQIYLGRFFVLIFVLFFVGFFGYKIIRSHLRI